MIRTLWVTASLSINRSFDEKGNHVRKKDEESAFLFAFCFPIAIMRI